MLPTDPQPPEPQVHRLLALAAVLALPALSAAGAPAEGRLAKIKSSKAITLAYRTDALPFAYEQDGKPAGFSVELCKRVVAGLEQQLGVPLAVTWVAATTQNRLELVKTGKADVECGSTSATLSRMEQVDFSSPIFLDATSLLVRKDLGAKSLTGLAGKRIAVVAGTTNEKVLKQALESAMVAATVVPAANREEAVAALEAGKADALAGDRVLLAGLAAKVKDASIYQLLDDELGLEPYALVLPRGDADLRLAVNRALARIYGGDALAAVFRQAFGSNVKPSTALVVMYAIHAYAE